MTSAPIAPPHSRVEDALGLVTGVYIVSLGIFGLRAGYVQMGLDVAVVLGSFFVVDPGIVVLSALGAVVLNVVLAFNHRPGRYMGL
jgi:uncharacterized membrane-anchored protein YitT (DUF2179 family)